MDNYHASRDEKMTEFTLCVWAVRVYYALICFGIVQLAMGFLGLVKTRLEWKFPDLWIGVFWRVDGQRVDVWTCILPCLPIHSWLDHEE